MVEFVAGDAEGSLLDGAFGLEQLALLRDVRGLKSRINQHFTGLLLCFFGSRQIPCKFVIFLGRLAFHQFCYQQFLLFLQLKCLGVQRRTFRDNFLFFFTNFFLHLFVPFLQ